MYTVRATFFFVILVVFLTGLDAQTEGWQEDNTTAKSPVYVSQTVNKSIQPTTDANNLTNPISKPIILSPLITEEKHLTEQHPLPPIPVIIDKNEPKEIHSEQPLMPPRPVIIDRNEPKDPPRQNPERPPAVDPDAYEYDDNSTYAQLIYPGSVNQAQFHSIHVQYNEDWYTFYGYVGNTYVFYSSGSTDVVVWLYANDTVTQLDYDDDDGEGTNFYLEFVPTTEGFYYLKVMGYSTTTGYYNFNYSFFSNPDAYEPDDNANYGTPLSIQPSIGYQYHTLHSTTDQDWYMFYGQANVTYDFWSGGNTDVRAWLFMEDGTTLLALDDDGGGYPNFYISYTVPSDGWYKVQVMGWSGAIGPYYIYYNYSIAADIYEPDDYSSSAQLVYPGPTNQTQPHSIHLAYNEDWYLFYGYYGNTYIFYSSGSIDTQAWLYQSDGVTYLDYDDDDGEGNNFYLAYAPAYDGFYYLKVMGFGSTTGSYTFNYSYFTNPDAYEPDNTAYNCSQLAIQPYASYQLHTLHQSADEDWYMFYGLANVTYNLWSTGNIDVRAWLFLEDGITCVAFDDDNGGSFNFLLNYTVPSDGWYKVQVNGYGGALGPYNFNHSYNNFTDYYEPDNSSSQSWYLPLQTDPYSLRHTIYPEYDEDWHRFYGVAGWTYQFFSTYNTDTMIELYYDDGVTMLASDDDGGDGFNFLLSFIPTFSEYYKVKVKAYGGNSGIYDFHVQLNSVPDIFEPNDNAGNCSQILINSYVTTNYCTFHTSTDEDWIQFYGLNGLACSFWSTGSLDTQAWLYMENGTTQLAYDDDSGDGANFLISYTLPSDGWYKLKIISWGGSLGAYALSFNYSDYIDLFEPDNTTAESRFITPDINPFSERHSIYPAYDEDWFGFYAFPGVHYEFYSSFNTDTIIEIYGNDGTTLLADNDDGGQFHNFYLVFDPVSEAMYYVKIKAYLSLTGVYDFHYRMWVDPDAFEPDNSAYQATALTISNDAYFQLHSIHDYADDDWFSFLGIPGRNYEFYSSGTSDMEARVFNADGNMQLAYDDDSGGSPNFLITFSPTEYAIYKLKINCWSHQSLGLYGFNYRYFVNPDAFETDSQNQPVQLSITSDWSQLNRTIHVSDDQDWHRFEGVADRTYTFESGGFTNVLAYLYDDSAITVLTWDDDGNGYPNFRITFTPAVTAFYKLLVITTGQDLGAYELYYKYETSALSPPVNLEIAQSGDLIFLSWDAVPGATSYRIESSDNPYTGFSTAGVTDALSWATTSFPGRCFFRVIAQN